MAGWFEKLMQSGSARPTRVVVAGVTDDAATTSPRDTRYDAIVQALRDREVEDREAREKRQRWYRQHVPGDSPIQDGSAPMRLYRFSTKVPCRASPDAQTLLDQLRHRFAGGTVTFTPHANGRQALMLSEKPGGRARQIGWLEQCAETDPARSNVRHHGLSVETDGGSLLVLRFRYPATSSRMSSLSIGTGAFAAPDPVRIGADSALGPSGEEASVDFSEIRPALDVRPADKGATPRLVWVTRTEVETMNALRSRDYEAFYVRFKLEVLAGLWSALTTLLAASPASHWHGGAHYTVVREPDAARGKIFQRSIDDSGRRADIGIDRIYDAFPATDILLLYLDGDLLADFADICFTLQSLDSADAWFLKEEFFTIIRRFWAGSRSLASRYGGDVAAVVRMAQRAVPMPAQAVLLRQDWTSLRQSLVDRYGEGGRKAAGLCDQNTQRRAALAAWPFASFPAGEVNLGLRLVYRQEWKHTGAQRGEVIRRVAPRPNPVERSSTGAATAADAVTLAHPRVAIETTVQPARTGGVLTDVVDDAADAVVAEMKWPRDFDGSINTGVRPLASRTGMGLEAECRASSRDTSVWLSDTMRRAAARNIRAALDAADLAVLDETESALPDEVARNGDDPATYVYSRLQNRYGVFTRPAEIQNVVMVAERLPAPAEIDRAWVRRHDWILSRALLDESFRGALDDINRDGADPETSEVAAARARLYEHLRANILHYQRAIWRQEDPQRRSMRYRKSGRKVPLDWRFELEAAPGLAIEQLADRLSAPEVDGQFATYSDGREAELDQVIDPAGLIGYHANYAVYQMRPEFGGADLFAMLHFFKSPWLRAHPDGALPDVGDPAQEEMDDRAFREQRMADVTLDTDGVVVDAIRAVSADPLEGLALTEVVGAPASYELMMEGAPAVELFTVSGHREREERWAILGGAGGRMSALMTGALLGGARPRETEVPIMIVNEGGAVPAARLLAGSAAPPLDDARAERVIVLPVAQDPGPALLSGGAPDAGHHGRFIAAPDDQWLTPIPVAGNAGPSRPAHHFVEGL